jgi:hypothetical protein
MRKIIAAVTLTSLTVPPAAETAQATTPPDTVVAGATDDTDDEDDGDTRASGACSASWARSVLPARSPNDGDRCPVTTTTVVQRHRRRRSDCRGQLSDPTPEAAGAPSSDGTVERRSRKGNDPTPHRAGVVAISAARTPWRQASWITARPSTTAESLSRRRRWPRRPAGTTVTPAAALEDQSPSWCSSCLLRVRCGPRNASGLSGRRRTAPTPTRATDPSSRSERDNGTVSLYQRDRAPTRGLADRRPFDRK